MFPRRCSFGAANFRFLIQSWRVARVMPTALAASPVVQVFGLITCEAIAVLTYLSRSK